VFEARSFYLTPVPIRPRSRGERRSLRTFFPGARFSPPRVHRFQSRHTATPFNSASDAFERHPDVRSYREDAATAAAVLLPAVGTGAYLDALEKRDFDVFDPGLIRGTMPLVTQARIGWNAYRGTY